MLAEALLYLITPAPSWARRHGYLKESISIGARHARLKRAWEPHLNHSRNAVLEAANLCAGHQSAVILGSGHGFDLPLRALAGQFSKVILIDAVHPLAMRWQVRALENVSLVTADITARFTPMPVLPASPDLVVSLNLISQLGIASSVTEDERGSMRQKHLDWLMSLRSTVCVIGDVERTQFGPARTDERTVDVTWTQSEELPKPAASHEWTWPVAPRGEISPEIEITSRVRSAVWLPR